MPLVEKDSKKFARERVLPGFKQARQELRYCEQFCNQQKSAEKHKVEPVRFSGQLLNQSVG